ncbi:MAG: hypothetical protein AB9880_05180 [Christensenellales bacterium]
MNKDSPLSDRLKSIHLPDKALLWIIAFVAFALLCLVLVFVFSPWLLKVLFLLLFLAASAYCWIMIESWRSTPKPRPMAPPAAAPAEPEAEAAQPLQREDAAPHQTETEDEAYAAADEEPDGKSDQAPGEPVEGLVYVSGKGDKYHADSKCVGLRFADSIETMTEADALLLKRKPCSKCSPKTHGEAPQD